MKTLLLLCLLLPFAGRAQPTPAPPAGQESPTVFKRANLLVIHTPDSAKVALRKVAGLLQARGFSIDRLDYDLLSVSTKPKPFANSSQHTMQVLGVAEGGTVRLSATWHGQMGSISVDEPAAFTNAASKRAFAELEETGKAYPGASVGYRLRP